MMSDVCIPAKFQSHEGFRFSIDWLYLPGSESRCLNLAELLGMCRRCF